MIDDRELIKRVDQWPAHPFLPVKYYPQGVIHQGVFPEMGILCAYDGFFLGTSKQIVIHLIPFYEMLRRKDSRKAYLDAPTKEYDDVYSFLGDGWRVD